MTRLSWCGTAVAVLLAAAGCGGPSSPAAGDGVVSSGPMSPGPSGATPGSNEVLPEPAVGLTAQPWQRAEPVPGSAELLVYATLTGGPPCAVLGRAEVTEGADAVTVTLWVGRRPDAVCDGPQPDLGYPVTTRVALTSPLGDRTVRDGAR